MTDLDGTWSEYVHGREWDIMIVLDAFRYDYFKELYQFVPQINEDDLYKLDSEGRATPEVLINTFPGYYDWPLISGHFWISNENKIDEKDSRLDEHGGYDAAQHFREVHDVWYQENGPVSRGHVTKSAIEETDVINDDKTIVWYLEPHVPYNASIRFGWSQGSAFTQDMFEMENGEVYPGIRRFIKMAYLSNAIHALYHASLVATEFEANVVITADHGENLFDTGKTAHHFGHSGSKGDGVETVPWLEVNAHIRDAIIRMDHDEYVRQLYHSVHDREPDESGHKTWTDKLNNQVFSQAECLEAFIMSDENMESWDRNIFVPGSTNDSCRVDTDTEKQLRDLGYL